MTQPNPVLDYLKRLPVADRMPLSRLRKQILEVAPQVEERLCRGVPFFYHQGKRVVGFRASQTHLSLFIMDGQVLKSHRSALSGLDHSATVIRFDADHPIPESVLRRLIRARVDEIESKSLPARRGRK